MKLASYWLDTAPKFSRAEEGPVEGAADVAVIGAGFTGLSAARVAARGGARVAVLEARHVGAGGSGRNGGHVNSGLAHGYLAAKAHLGAERAATLYRAFDAAVDTVEAIVAEEGIDCAFRRSGKLKLASKPAHYEALARNFEAIHAEVDPDTALLTKADLAGEIETGHAHGALLTRRSAMMHMGRYVGGLADAVVRHGGRVFENAPVTERRREGKGWRLETPRGTITAERVILATGAYTSGPFGYFRRRIVPVGSFIVATRPLTGAEIEATMPGRRTCVTSLRVGNYFRLSPDDRLIFGGRARFSAVSDARSDALSGRVLQAELGRIFPVLKGIGIDWCWGGLVGATRDFLPRAGEADGVLFAMGYSGHGAQMASHIGAILGEIALGRPDRNPFAGMEWPAIPLHFGKPWFLPAVGAWYRLLDRIA